MSILELVFAETRQPIGHAEFDLGAYTNKIQNTLVKSILDLKSDKFPGCQIYIYVQIQLLDPLPEKGSALGSNTEKPGEKFGHKKVEEPSHSNTIDLNKNLFEIRKIQMI